VLRFGLAAERSLPVPEQLVYSSANLEVTLLPSLGARLHRLRAFGHDLLRTPDDPRTHETDPFFWGGYVMAPWCNRVATGPLKVGDRVIDLPQNFSDGSAIHGQVYVASSRQTGEGEFTIVGRGGGWPWPYSSSLAIEVTGDDLRLHQRLTNLADDPMPAGLGLHPWFRDPISIAIHAQRAYGSNTDSPAVATPVRGNLDLRQLQPMAIGTDATWVDVSDPPVELFWTNSGVRATLRASAPALHITAANPGIGAIAVEPQTHAPQGLRRLTNQEDGALQMLDPTESLVLTSVLSFARE
jgi:aldose 1-epimerase